MYFVIWLCCLIPAGVLITVIEQAGGVELGALPKTLIAGTAVAIAIILCRKRKQNKKAQEDKSEILDDDDEFEVLDLKNCLEDEPDLLEIKKSLDRGECPCCFHTKIGKMDDRCYYCGYNLSEQRKKIEEKIKREEERIRKEEEKRKNLIASAQIKISKGTNLVMIYFRPCTCDYRCTEIELYKDGMLLTEYKVDKEMYFKSIDGLAHGIYEFVLKQFDKKNRIIMETDKISFLF